MPRRSCPGRCCALALLPLTLLPIALAIITSGCSLPASRAHILETPQPYEQDRARREAHRHLPPFERAYLLDALDARKPHVARCLALATPALAAREGAPTGAARPAADASSAAPTEVGVLVRFRVEPDGRVRIERTSPAPHAADAVDRCLHLALGGLLTRPFSGKPRRLDVPFVFRPVSPAN